MQLNVNTSIETLLGIWGELSYKAVNGQLVDRDNLASFIEVKSILKRKGIEALTILSVDEEEITVHYVKHGSEFKMKIRIN